MLLNYRVRPEVVAKLLPRPFRPKMVGDLAIAGICLIRLRDIRLRGFPGFLGFRSENAAHRIAVEWDDGGIRREGVYVPRRDTSSRLSTFLGGRLFPGIYHHANFHVCESSNRFELRMQSDDGEVRVSVCATLTNDLPATSRFGDLAEASAFFERGSIGYSATADPHRFDGLELRTRQWKVEPLAVDHVGSSFFENADVFPGGSVEFDCALLMRNIDHEWHSRGQVCNC